MAHVDIDQPNRRSGRMAPPTNKNGSPDDVTDFIPIPSSIVPTPAPTAAEPSPAPKAPESPAQKAPAEESAAPAPAEIPEEPKKAGKRGRPPKGSNGEAEKPKSAKPTPPKKSDTEERRKQVNFYMEESDHRSLRFYCFQQNRTFTDLMETLALATLKNGYRCREAGCNCEFVICSTLSDDTPRCPACGSKRIDPLVSH